MLPGTSTHFNYNVGSLPTGTRLTIHIEIFRSENPDPQVVVIAGVHSDEINGVELVRRTVAQNMFSELKAGSVIVIPLLNVYGFINFIVRCLMARM